jgi:hypothetical protein
MGLLLSYLSGFLLDADGHKSSKRLCGILLILFGCIISFLILILNFIVKPYDYVIIKYIIEITMVTGASLLGIGVIEKFPKNKDNAKN